MVKVCVSLVSPLKLKLDGVTAISKPGVMLLPVAVQLAAECAGDPLDMGGLLGHHLLEVGLRLRGVGIESLTRVP